MGGTGSTKIYTDRNTGNIWGAKLQKYKKSNKKLENLGDTRKIHKNMGGQALHILKYALYRR